MGPPPRLCDLAPQRSLSTHTELAHQQRRTRRRVSPATAARLPGDGGGASSLCNQMGRGGPKNRHGRERGRPRGRWHGRGKDEEGTGEVEDMPAEGAAGPGEGLEKGEKHGHGKEGKKKGKEKQGGEMQGKQAPSGDAISQAVMEMKVKAAERLREEIKRQRIYGLPKFTLHISKKNEELKKNDEIEENDEFEETQLLKRNIQRFVFERLQRFRSTRATSCQGVPVTSPNPPEKDDKAEEGDPRPGEITYHVLVFVTKYGRLEVLIREYDGYVVAIRPQPKDSKQKGGWFHYSDVVLPVHLFGTKNWMMNFNSGYLYHQYVQMGKECLDQMVKMLLTINESNYMKKDSKIGDMLQTLNVFAGETQRLSVILRFFLINIDASPWVPLGALSVWTNNWANLGDGIVQLVMSLMLKIMLKRDAAKKEMSKAEESLQNYKKVGTPLTQDDVGPRYLRDPRVHSQGVKGPVFGSDVAKNELYLPLLLGYILLMRYNRKLVPSLMLREKEFATFLKVKEKEDEATAKLEEEATAKAGEDATGKVISDDGKMVWHQVPFSGVDAEEVQKHGLGQERKDGDEETADEYDPDTPQEYEEDMSQAQAVKSGMRQGSRDKSGMRQGSRDKSGMRQGSRDRGHPIGTPPSNHSADHPVPPPGPRMPDGTKGFAMG